MHPAPRRPPPDGYDVSPLDVLDQAFTALVSGPDPLSLDGRTVGRGLPRRLIPLDELKTILLHPSTSYPTREAVWAELVRLSRTGEPAWTVGVTGVAIPGLRRAAGRLSRDYPSHAALVDDYRVDVDAEVLTGFLAALATIDVAAGHLPARLCWAGYRAGRSRCRREVTEARHRAGPVEGTAPMRPYGHPDLVLLAAVDAGVITLAEARLIGATRLDGMDLQQLAARLGVTYAAVRMWRSRAERRLTRFLVSGELPKKSRVSQIGPKGGLEGCGTSRAGTPIAGRPSGADNPHPHSIKEVTPSPARLPARKFRTRGFRGGV
ncbi:MAG TPA: hypothetical protein VNG13_12575 [Mycobacteriales bacterium]|nr:hypothetical protein [Mycobacteriales bacterium]